MNYGSSSSTQWRRERFPHAHWIAYHWLPSSGKVQPYCQRTDGRTWCTALTLGSLLNWEKGDLRKCCFPLTDMLRILQFKPGYTSKIHTAKTKVQQLLQEGLGIVTAGVTNDITQIQCLFMLCTSLVQLIEIMMGHCSLLSWRTQRNLFRRLHPIRFWCNCCLLLDLRGDIPDTLVRKFPDGGCTAEVNTKWPLWQLRKVLAFSSPCVENTMSDGSPGSQPDLPPQNF